MLIEFNSCDVLAYKARLFDVTPVIRPSQVQELLIVYSKISLTMIEDIRACDGQITNLTSDNRFFVSQNIA